MQDKSACSAGWAQTLGVSGSQPEPVREVETAPKQPRWSVMLIPTAERLSNPPCKTNAATQRHKSTQRLRERVLQMTRQTERPTHAHR